MSQKYRITFALLGALLLLGALVTQTASVPASLPASQLATALHAALKGAMPDSELLNLGLACLGMAGLLLSKKY
jgi:hypothetical protein